MASSYVEIEALCSFNIFISAMNELIYVYKLPRGE